MEACVGTYLMEARSPNLLPQETEMGKLLVFYLIWRITGNPFLAIIVILAIYYFVDRRYIGLLPNIAKPFQRRRRMSNLRRQLQMNPHDTPAKHYLAEAYIEVRQYQRALSLL